MKQAIIIITSVMLATICQGQVPQAFSFQSLVLDANGDPVSDQSIGVLIQIIDGAPTGAVLYSESHSPITNSNGLYSIEIGNGDVVSGSFGNIDWLGGLKYVSLSHDITGGTSYTLVGSSQLLSVPYALAAGTSFIAPKIYASTARVSPSEIDVNQTERPEIFSYRYEWIQGEPEDVYVEYSNLPDNINIQNRNGSDFIVNGSSVDTIIDGIIRPTSYFGVADPSVSLTPGSYLIDMTFRTSTEVLAEIKYPLDIIDPTVEEVDCTEDFVGERIITSICSELDNLVDIRVIEIEKVDNRNMVVRNFLNTNADLEITFENDECVEMRINNSLAISIGQFTIENIEVFANNGNLEFRVDLIDQNADDISCEVVYGM